MSFVLSAETIGMLGNGSAATKIDRVIREMIADVVARGSDEQPRKVIIEIDMHATPEGSISFGHQVSYKMPKFSGPRVLGEVRGAGVNQRVEVDDESESERAA